jgi:hypothetical protein
MNIYLVDIKNEYTSHLIKILTPVIFEGIQSIYDNAKDCLEEQSLKLFQEYLRNIPNWNNNTIMTETDRIKTSTKTYLEALMRATIKANIMLLAFNPFNKNDKMTIDKNLHRNIQLSDFIHHIYIECAREFWNNPYLLYHKYSPVDIKRNQRDSLSVIKESIREAIRKLLPIEDIVKIYLNDNISEETEKKITEDLKHFTENDDKPKPNPKIDNTTGLSDITEQNIPQLLEKQPEKQQNTKDLLDISVIESSEEAVSKNIESKVAEKATVPDLMKGGNKSSDEDLLKKIEMKINSNHSTVSSVKPIKKTKDLDKKLEDVLGDTDIETSINYSPENNINDYQEIYGNNSS